MSYSNPQRLNQGRCLLLGGAISYSYSPIIHNTAFAALNLDLVYEVRSVKTAELGAVLDIIREGGIFGANVTIPHKHNVLPFLDRTTDTASRVGAVNTIFKKDGKLIGDNTDVEGFLSPLMADPPDLSSVLVLGSGGAARAVIHAVGQYLGGENISVASRNLEKARALGGVTAIGWEDRFTAAQGATMIVNATPIGTHPKTLDSPLPCSGPNPVFNSSQLVYDLVYNPSTTRLTRDARDAGSRVIGGLDMLIAQAAASFTLWTGREMPVSLVRRALLAEFESGT